MSDILERIVAATRIEVDRRRAASDFAQLRRAARERSAAQPPRGFAASLRAPGVSVIAEYKRRSPSAGVIREGAELAGIVSAYARGGAAAISVLTDGPHFGGSLEDLEQARAACRLPVLRKDFIVDPWQLAESAAAGADAVLLIVAALEQPQLALLHEQALDLGLEVLVEVHDSSELDRARALDPVLVGINNRDLRDFTVDFRRSLELAQALEPGPVVVSESGIGEPEQLERLSAAGVHAVLVGESLMRADDPETALRDLLGAVGFSPPLSGA